MDGKSAEYGLGPIS